MKKFFVSGLLLALAAGSPAWGYITNPRGTLETFLNDTPIVSVFRVERVEKRGEGEGTGDEMCLGIITTRAAP